MKIDRELKVILLQILISNEIAAEQKEKLISKLVIEQPFCIMPDGKKILI